MNVCAETSAAGEAYCPHCYLPVATAVEGPWPAVTTRCPHCRLMIGAGRAHSRADGVPGARGAAAGVMAERARRIEEVGEHTEEEIGAAIRGVAGEIGVNSERLLMVDYQQRTLHDGSLPPLHAILARFGSWKQARRAAVSRRDE